MAETLGEARPFATPKVAAGAFFVHAQNRVLLLRPTYEGDKMLFVFDGGTLSQAQLDAIRFGDGEIGEWRFVDAAELDELTIPRLARRIRQALNARSQQKALYLQQGAVLA